MSLQTWTSNLPLNSKRTLLALLAAPTAAYILSKTILPSYLATTPTTKDEIHHAPRRPSTSHALATCPYPPDSLPGGRDIPTPYGSIRAYEWGPANGRKVLFIHGISNPSIALAELAQTLVDIRGCRVLLFDLFGRGWSDAPASCAQDSRLWTTQVSLVLGSSELDWWRGGFTVAGYSLGGGIAADFASWFPAAVEGLVLLAPAGLLREERVGWWSRAVYGGWLPRGLVEGIVRRRLRGDSPPPQEQKEKKKKIDLVQSAEAEAPYESREEDGAVLFPDRPRFSVADTAIWQVDAHPGFVPSFISSIQNSPINGQQYRWRLIGSRLDRQRLKLDDQDSRREGMQEGKVLLLLGKEDSIILADEIAADAAEALGRSNLKVEVLDGGHDFPIVRAKDCARIIGEFWDQN